MRKLLLVGGTGYIGKQFRKVCLPDYELICTSSSANNSLLKLDLANPLEFAYSQFQPGDVCLLTAAISSPDVCVSKFEYAWAVNVTGTSKFIERLIERGVRIIFFSSDTVYGHQETPFNENSTCSPVGEYALMKREVETRFMNNDQFKCIRLSYVFSHEDKFTNYLLNCAKDSKEAELFHPFYRAIVHRDDVVEGALALARRWQDFPDPIINFGGPDLLSRIDFAECLRKQAIPQLMYRHIIPEDDFFAKRPRTIAMLSPVFEQLLGRMPHKLAEAIEYEKIAQSQLSEKVI
jgi:dTDP-4-dehydrorhamnose reductase